ncbi:putative short-chain dehydrogenase [Glonium stellatum]|uniref:Putative short-chain dehydrogenase n=1 Tax=Glonium stellatum TaxID=574774 RepID=A0A8E2F289_9PEZI|nr:putative short-chain dehydrogenase [Glonium stellatum]
MSAPFPSLTKTWHTEAYPAISPTRPEVSSKGKTIVITGGGSGLGARIARDFAASGASKLALLGRTERTLLATKRAIEAEFPSTTISTFVADVTSKPAVDAAFASIRSTLGPIHVFVNNAGYLPAMADAATTPLDEWWLGFDINVKGSLLATQAFLRAKVPEGAVLINVSTAIVHIPPMAGFSGYAASKLAATKFFDYVQVENPALHVVNVQPGIVETNMNIKSEMPAMDNENLPGAFLVWLASPEAKFLKGKFVWVNWDVEEMKAKAKEIEEGNLLTLSLEGWPFA